MPEEAARAVLGDEGEGGARPTGSVTFLTFSLQGKRQACFFLCLFSPFSMSGGLFWGGRRQGRPTRIDHFDLGQDMGW